MVRVSGGLCGAHPAACLGNSQAQSLLELSLPAPTTKQTAKF